MFVIGLMIALFVSEVFSFLSFSKTSEILLDVSAGVEKVINIDKSYKYS